MKLVMVDNDGNAIELEFAEEGSVTTARMLEVFGKCVELQRRKGQTYGDAYRSQGYMGNLARVLSKASRLKNMMWRDYGIEDAEESVLDTVADLINLSAFFIINLKDGNKWGK